MKTASVSHLPAPKRREQALPHPDEYQITTELQRWAAEHGVTRLADRLEHFADYCANRAKPYRDWQAAFRNACRQDWAKLGLPAAVSRCPRCTQPITGGWTQRRDGRVCDACDRQGTL